MKTLDFKEELIKRVRNGDRASQYAFYECYSRAMFNICMRMLNDRGSAEDVLQKSFMDAFTNIHSYNGKSTPGAWLKRIVINNCINQLKKRKLQLVEMEDRHAMVAEPQLEERHFNVETVRRAIGRLPDGYRAVLTLYLLEGYDHAEIGKIMGISESTSKSQFSRAKKKLKQIIVNDKMNIFYE